MKVWESDFVAGWPPAAVTATGLQISAVQTSRKIEVTDTDRNTADATSASSSEVPLSARHRRVVV